MLGLFKKKNSGLSEYIAYPPRHERSGGAVLFAGNNVTVKEFLCWVGIANESDQVTKGRLVDALVVRGDEGRGTLR